MKKEPIKAEDLFDLTTKYIEHCNATDSGNEMIYQLCCAYHVFPTMQDGEEQKLINFFTKYGTN